MMKCSRYYCKHLLFVFQPAVLILPIALYIDRSAIEISTLWFSVIWYWKKQDNE